MIKRIMNKRVLIGALIVFAIAIVAVIQHLDKKTLWDSLQLFINPVTIVLGGFFLGKIQRDREEIATAARDKIEREIVFDKQSEETLQAYIDEMLKLLLNKKIAKEDVYKATRQRTLTVLSCLHNERDLIANPALDQAGTSTGLYPSDKKRKRAVLQFLYEWEIIDKDKCTNLKEAILKEA